MNTKLFALLVATGQGFALDEHGQIMHFTAAYDSSLRDDPTYQALVLLAAEQ